MKRKALFIGVNEYKDPAIRNLSCSVRDAISMHDIFEELGYQTNLLENSGNGDVFHAVREMTSDMAAGDQFLFYFAWHGFTDGGQHLLFALMTFMSICASIGRASPLIFWKWKRVKAAMAGRFSLTPASQIS